MSKAKKAWADPRTDYFSWESSAAACFGGCYAQWPQWAQKVVREHYGYLP